jgi:hypothetical protein
MNLKINILLKSKSMSSNSAMSEEHAAIVQKLKEKVQKLPKKEKVKKAKPESESKVKDKSKSKSKGKSKAKSNKGKIFISNRKLQQLKRNVNKFKESMEKNMEKELKIILDIVDAALKEDD